MRKYLLSNLILLIKKGVPFILSLGERHSLFIKGLYSQIFFLLKIQAPSTTFLPSFSIFAK